MAKTNVNTSLIQGAAVAYKNYDNDPSIYKGFDQSIQSFNKSLTQDARAAAKELAGRNKIARNKKKEQDKEWNKTTKKVRESGEGLSGQYRALVTEELELLQEKLYNTDDKNVEAEIMRRLEEITQESGDYVNMFSEYADEEMGMSSAMDANGTIVGNNGKEKEIMTHVMGQKGVWSINDEGQKIHYGMTNNGHEYSLTKEQMDEMFVRKTPQLNNAFSKVYSKATNRSKWNRVEVETEIKNIIPEDINQLRAFTSDKIMNQNFAEMLDYDSTFESEVNNYLNEDPRFDTNADTPGIDRTEFEMMKKALTDPFHPIWNGDKDEWAEVVRPLLAERLTNAIENGHQEVNGLNMNAEEKREYYKNKAINKNS